MRRQEDVRHVPDGQPGGEAPETIRGGDEGPAPISVRGMPEMAHRGPRPNGSEEAGRAWESLHAARAWGQYPNEHVVRAVMREFGRREPRNRLGFLDVGAGGGAHTWFLAREGFRVRALDVSQAALRRISSRMTTERIGAAVAYQQCDIARVIC